MRTLFSLLLLETRLSFYVTRRSTRRSSHLQDKAIFSFHSYFGTLSICPVLRIKPAISRSVLTELIAFALVYARLPDAVRKKSGGSLLSPTSLYQPIPLQPRPKGAFPSRDVCLFYFFLNNNLSGNCSFAVLFSLS